MGENSMINVNIEIKQVGEKVRYVYSAKTDKTATPAEMAATEEMIEFIQIRIAAKGGTGEGVAM